MNINIKIWNKIRLSLIQNHLAIMNVLSKTIILNQMYILAVNTSRTVLLDKKAQAVQIMDRNVTKCITIMSVRPISSQQRIYKRLANCAIYTII